MAHFVLDISAGIHAEIAGGDKEGFINIPCIIDALSESFSGFAPLNNYDLELSSISGLTDIVLLKNGSNSRFTSATAGSCTLTLEIEDDVGNKDTDSITITIT